MNFDLTRILIAIPGIIIGLSLHEFAHGYAAYLLGDDTAKHQGRLTLNPLAHLDPLGTMMIFFTLMSGFGFGWAKPVPVSPHNFTRKVTMRTGMMLTALAGPLTNFIIAFFSVIVLSVMYYGLGIQDQFLKQIINGIVSVNVTLGIFNLLPVPPLDGSKILAGILPRRFDEVLYKLEQYGTLILIILLFTGIFGIVLNPIANFIYNCLGFIEIAIASLFI